MNSVSNKSCKMLNISLAVIVGLVGLFSASSSDGQESFIASPKRVLNIPVVIGNLAGNDRVDVAPPEPVNIADPPVKEVEYPALEGKVKDILTITVFRYTGSDCVLVCKILSSGTKRCYEQCR